MSHYLHGVKVEVGTEFKDQDSAPSEIKVGDKVRVKANAASIAPHDDKDNLVGPMGKYLGEEGIAREGTNFGWFAVFGWDWSKNWLEKVEE